MDFLLIQVHRDTGFISKTIILLNSKNTIKKTVFYGKSNSGAAPVILQLFIRRKARHNAEMSGFVNTSLEIQKIF